MIRHLTLILTIVATTAAAQWLHHTTSGIPRLPDGKPNLAAPAPKTGDGEPDLSGVWRSGNITFDLKPEDVLPWAEALTSEICGTLCGNARRPAHLLRDLPCRPRVVVLPQRRPETTADG